ncbi:MAG: hypothetical protein ACLPN1_13340 [Dissulfurispiraceae bacterium]|jgi:hypothetical protein
MSSRFEISEVLSAIDNFLENRELRHKDPDLALSFIDQLRKLEDWFIGKVYLNNSKFLKRVVEFCQNEPQNDIRKFMAFARYSFRQLGSERFEDCINRSGLTSREKWMIIGFFRISEIDHELAHSIADAAKPANEICC